jgi:hypothetical protein
MGNGAQRGAANRECRALESNNPVAQCYNEIVGRRPSVQLRDVLADGFGERTRLVGGEHRQIDRLIDISR